MLVIIRGLQALLLLPFVTSFSISNHVLNSPTNPTSLLTFPVTHHDRQLYTQRCFSQTYRHTLSRSSLDTALSSTKVDQRSSLITDVSKNADNKGEQSKLDATTENSVILNTDKPFIDESFPEMMSISDKTINVDAEGFSEIESSTSFGEGIFWRGVVVVLCALWASNFAAAKLIMAEPGVDSSLYAVARFSVALLAMVPGTIADIRRGILDWDIAKGAAICGSWVAFGYLGQTLGLLTTTASKSCVICSLHCVFVAVVAEFIRVNKAMTYGENKSFDFTKLIPAVLAVIGVAIVELQGTGSDPSIGDLLSFAQPIGFGMGYLQLEELIRKKPDAGFLITAIKLVMVSIFSFGMFEFYPVFQHEAFSFRIPDFTPILSSPLALGGILYTGLITTALSLVIESAAFKRVPATDASVILTTEPLFAAFIGAITLGETFGSSDYIGATLIIGACALAVLSDKKEDNECDSIPEGNATLLP